MTRQQIADGLVKALGRGRITGEDAQQAVREAIAWLGTGFKTEFGTGQRRDRAERPAYEGGTTQPTTDNRTAGNRPV